jgi:hypothetical protein
MLSRQRTIKPSGSVKAATAKSENFGVRRNAALDAVVVIFTVTPAVCAPSRVTLLGEGVQVDFDGAPVQLMLTA